MEFRSRVSRKSVYWSKKARKHSVLYCSGAAFDPA
jgi:hypothetical protein